MALLAAVLGAIVARFGCRLVFAKRLAVVDSRGAWCQRSLLHRVAFGKGGTTAMGQCGTVLSAVAVGSALDRGRQVPESSDQG